MSVIKEFLFSLGWKVDNAGLDEAEKKGKKAARATADEWKEAGKTIGKSLAAVGVAAVGAAAGIFKLAESSAAAGDEAAKASKQAGVAADQYQRMAFAIQRSGGSLSGLDRSLRAMTLNLENAAQKGTGPLVDGLKRVGLEAEDLIGLSLEDKLATISEALNSVGDENRRSGIAMQIFGSRGGAEMKVLLDEGASGIRALGDEAERLGLVMGEDALNASEAFTDTILDVKSTLKALVRDVGISIIPTVSAAITSIKEWAVSNRELISTKIEQVIHAVMASLETLIPSLLEVLPLVAELVRIGAEISSSLGPGGATAAIIGLKTAMSGALGPAGLLATAIATIASALINVASQAQNARFALDDLLNGGRGKRGEGTKFVTSAKEGKLQANRRKAAERVRQAEDILRSPTTGAADFKRKKSAQASKQANLKRIADLDKRIAAARKEAAIDDQQASVFTGPNLADAGSDRVDKPSKGRKTKKDSKEDEAAKFRANDLFGEEVRKIVAANGAGEAAIASSLDAAAGSIKSGATDAVARKAALSRLGSLVGKDLTPKKKSGRGTDPLLSEILGDENVPDIELSSIARGANPQTLISNITNNVTVGDTNIEVSGAGSPGDVATETARRFDERLSEVFSKASKTAKTPFLR